MSTQVRMCECGMSGVPSRGTHASRGTQKAFPWYIVTVLLMLSHGVMLISVLLSGNHLPPWTHS